MKSRTAAGGVALVTVAAALAATGTGPASGASQHRAATVKVITRHLDVGALPIGVGAGLPLHRFALEDTADAHRAVERGVVGKVLVDVATL